MYDGLRKNIINHEGFRLGIKGIYHASGELSYRAGAFLAEQAIEMRVENKKIEKELLDKLEEMKE